MRQKLLDVTPENEIFLTFQVHLQIFELCFGRVKTLGLNLLEDLLLDPGFVTFQIEVLVQFFVLEENILMLILNKLEQNLVDFADEVHKLLGSMHLLKLLFVRNLPRELEGHLCLDPEPLQELVIGTLQLLNFGSRRLVFGSRTLLGRPNHGLIPTHQHLFQFLLLRQTTDIVRTFRSQFPLCHVIWGLLWLNVPV